MAGSLRKSFEEEGASLEKSFAVECTYEVAVVGEEEAENSSEESEGVVDDDL